MKNLFSFLFLLFLLSSCNKKENDDLLWERSFGKGEALSIKASADSGFAACGSVAGKPYFVRLAKDRTISIEIKSDAQGLFSSFWFDASGYINAGNSAGKMLVMRHSRSGDVLWEKTIDAGYRIDNTTIIYTGNGKLLAIGSASTDTTYNGTTGILFVTIDTTGQILSQKNVTDTRFVAAGPAVIDASGNIYLALTRKNTGSKTRAAVAKYNNQFAKLWETELYNNPSFGASGKNIIINQQGTLFVTGQTEVTSETGPVNNSFVTSLTGTGDVNWKKYLENANTGRDLLINDAGDVAMLNRNCCIIRYLNASDGADAGILRLLGQCNSKDTDVLGSSFKLSYDKNLLVAGSRGGNFFIALKASQTAI